LFDVGLWPNQGPLAQGTRLTGEEISQV